MERYVEKIFSVIKTDGLVPGALKIAKGLWAVIRYARPADVLFISSGAVGDSWRFRVSNVAEELRLHGISASITVQENIWLDKYAKNFKVFIFHRVTEIKEIKKLVEEIKSLEKEIIFETDDLIFDYEYFKNHEFFKNLGENTKKFYEDLGKGEILADPYVKTCTTTTSFLADKLREFGKHVIVVPNRLSMKDLEIAKEILRNRKDLHDSVRIGYFSGTMSHDRDFATIHEVLVKIMEKYPIVELFLVGHIGFSDELNKFRSRISKIPHVPRKKHFENIANVDINIVPLEVGDPFCEAKSELKFFEAGILRIPTVAASVRTFCEAIEDGIDGFVANNQDEWFEKLEKLISDKDFREQMGSRAREKAINNYSTENSNNEKYYEYLQNRIKKDSISF